VAVILLIIGIIAQGLGVGASAAWLRALVDVFQDKGYLPSLTLYLAIGLLAPAVKIALVLSTIVAFWPGGGLFSIGRGRVGQGAEPGGYSHTDQEEQTP